MASLVSVRVRCRTWVMASPAPQAPARASAAPISGPRPLPREAWEKDGQTRTTIEMTVDHIGKVAKAEDRVAETPSPF